MLCFDFLLKYYYCYIVDVFFMLFLLFLLVLFSIPNAVGYTYAIFTGLLKFSGYDVWV